MTSWASVCQDSEMTAVTRQIELMVGWFSAASREDAAQKGKARPE